MKTLFHRSASSRKLWEECYRYAPVHPKNVANIGHNLESTCTSATIHCVDSEFWSTL